MADPRTQKLADILVNYSIGVQPGNWVLINGDVNGLPLVNAVVEQVLRAGGNPTMFLGSDDIQEIILREANEDQLQWIAPIEKPMMEQIDAMIAVRASSNTRGLTGVDPSKQRIRQNSRRELMQTYMQRSAEGSLRWTVTQYPCPAYAQDADMSLSDYEDFVYKATFADQPDPIQCWSELRTNQARLVDWLRGKKQMVARGPNIDLTVSIDGRTFINCHGDANMPDGEIFTGPVENSVNGWVKFSYPAVKNGREVEGVEFYFENGKVMKATAKKNEDYLISQLDSDEGSRYLGEFAIGTNYGIQRFTKSILFDEKIGGTLHMAVGAGYPESGSLNRSSIHWDFICDMHHESEILVDGELFYKDGQFQV